MNPLYLLEECIKLSRMKYPESFALSTDGGIWGPDSRMVLAKDINPKTGRITFYTNYTSQKARQIEIGTGQVSALFYFDDLGMSFRISGRVVKCAEDNSDKYFDSRPLLSRAGAIASKQSKPLIHPLYLYFRVLMVLIFKKKKRPVDWGGYKIIVKKCEIHRMNRFRVHTRELYTYSKEWRKKYLWP